VTAPRHYNLRVTECRFAARLLHLRLAATHQPVAGHALPTTRALILKDVQDHFGAAAFAEVHVAAATARRAPSSYLLRPLPGCHLLAGLTFEQMVAAVEEHLHPAPYNRVELANLFGMSVRAPATLPRPPRGTGKVANGATWRRGV